MKKIIASVTVLCYLVVTCGIMVNAHYCMDRLASVHLFEKKADRCAKCGMDIHQSDGCCRDEAKLVKLDQDQNKVQFVSYELPALDIVAITPSEFIATSFYNDGGQRHYHNHSPPLLSAQDTYLQNNVFRI